MINKYVNARRIKIFTQYSILLLILTACLLGQQTLIYAGRLLNPGNGKVLENVEILIEGNTIINIGKGLKYDRSAQIINLKKETVLPGLIDSHTHICLTPDYSTKPPVLYKTNSYRALEGLAAAQKALLAGFTTLRDVDNEGADMADIAVRDAIKEGLFMGPRLIVSGWAISITSGHMNLTGLRPAIDKEVQQYAIMADNKDAMIAAIRNQNKTGVDFIKIYSTGTLRHINRDNYEALPQYDQEEVEYMVKEASRWGMDVATHAYGGKGAYDAVAGGVRSIEHGMFLDEKTLNLMVRKGTFWCPTMTVYLPEEGMNSEDKIFHEEIARRHRETFKKALKKGVKIAFGTDIGAMPHGDGWTELETMVNYGMTPVEALNSATEIGAELIRMEDKLGRIVPGYLADIIAVKGKPDKNIRAMQNVSFVMVNGDVVKHSK